MNDVHVKINIYTNSIYLVEELPGRLVSTGFKMLEHSPRGAVTMLWNLFAEAPDASQPSSTVIGWNLVSLVTLTESIAREVLHPAVTSSRPAPSPHCAA